MRSWAMCLIGLTLLAISGKDALAEKRVALVIGNSSYSNVPRLTNPAGDAEAMGLLLKSAGFGIVKTQNDLGVADMRRVVRDFSDATKDAEIALVFFAGHGMEVDGRNYLVPIDAKLERDIDVEDETVSLDRVLQVIEPAKRLRIVILDACRDNPFVQSVRHTVATRSVGRGLVGIEPTMPDTLVAFAAKAGSTAADGDSIHSPFTTALLKHLVSPGVDVRLAFGQVRDEVLKATSGRQEPFVYGSLGGGVVALAAKTGEEPVDAVSPDPYALAARDYEAAAKVGTKEAWDAFLIAYPSGFYADLARSQRAKVIATKPVAIPITPKPVAIPIAPKPVPTPNIVRRAVPPKESWLRLSGQISANDKWRPAGFAVSAA